jgi:hypothetical protein
MGGIEAKDVGETVSARTQFDELPSFYDYTSLPAPQDMSKNSPALRFAQLFVGV